jgi:small subunit ribosomal protein S11
MAEDKKTTKEVAAEEKIKAVRRNKKKTVSSGRIYITAGFNNTIVTFTDDAGKTLAWSSAGAGGFKGSKKSTPYAAQIAAENAAEKARAFGFEKGDVYVKGIGHGREQALRGLISKGISVQAIYDVTPVPHNGCRKPRTRRV